MIDSDLILFLACVIFTVSFARFVYVKLRDDGDGYGYGEWGECNSDSSSSSSSNEEREGEEEGGTAAASSSAIKTCHRCVQCQEDVTIDSHIS